MSRLHLESLPMHHATPKCSIYNDKVGKIFFQVPFKVVKKWPSWATLKFNLVFLMITLNTHLWQRRELEVTSTESNLEVSNEEGIKTVSFSYSLVSWHSHFIIYIIHETAWKILIQPGSFKWSIKSFGLTYL